ncbi:deoxynucleoside kinase [Parvibium lacunae]|uniref:Deoxynucleoside kinase n=2 Tax=Parvibium lacunae TaxID=1888893 RepID=A0A368L2I3_9BURK|nr:deoxynucleoside kinase [Parvibium lacunae]
MVMDRYQHIVIEGPIGAGKTSLARRLADILWTGNQSARGELLLEKPEDNPFLERFYRDSARYALQTQLFFLFQRLDQLKQLGQKEWFNKPIISDFLLDKDPLFAELTLPSDELALYRQIFNTIQPQTPQPDLVIYLQAQPDTLLERIHRRGNPAESAISLDYLRALCDAYSQFFHHYNAAPVLTVNTSGLNPIDSDEDCALLLQQIKNMRGKREFFNRG